MSSHITVALVGIGGYGSNYVTAMLDGKKRDDVDLIAAVDPFPAACPRLGDLNALGIPVYPSIEQMFAKHSPNLVVISSPIQLHCGQTVIALEHGCHVLCEKPLCATLEQIDQMIDARDRAKRQVAVGYQLSFAQTFLNLKEDIIRGLLGKPKRLSTIVCWPRGNRYYQRNKWAGRQFTDSGLPVFDSPVNNACAHYLQNMFFILGESLDRSAMPLEVTAELYRANAIENFDTAAIRCTTRDDAEFLFFVSHAVARIRGPVFKWEFEKAVVTFDDINEDGVVAHFTDGTVRQYGTPSRGVDKLWLAIDAIRSGKPTHSGIEASSAQTRVMAAAQQSEIRNFPASLIHEKDGEGDQPLIVVEGLEDVLLHCYHEHKLPRELGVEWAQPRVPAATT
jgi:predicted dehydrogenase